MSSCHIAVILRDISIKVISVKTFYDRHQHIEDLASKWGFDFDYIFDFDADELTERDLEKVCDDLPLRSASNTLKHMRAIELGAQSDRKYTLVLEDDVIFYPNFFDRLYSILTVVEQMTPGWLVFLGGADDRIDARYCSGGELVEDFMTTAEAYLVDRASCVKRMAHIEDYTISCQADHFIKMLDQELLIKQYRSSHPLAYQGSVIGSLKTTLDQSRSQHGQFWLSLRFFSRRFSKQLFPRIVFFLGGFLR